MQVDQCFGGDEWPSCRMATGDRVQKDYEKLKTVEVEVASRDDKSDVPATTP